MYRITEEEFAKGIAYAMVAASNREPSPDALRDALLKAEDWIYAFRKLKEEDKKPMINFMVG